MEDWIVFMGEGDCFHEDYVVDRLLPHLLFHLFFDLLDDGFKKG